MNRQSYQLYKPFPKQIDGHCAYRGAVCNLLGFIGKLHAKNQEPKIKRYESCETNIMAPSEVFHVRDIEQGKQIKPVKVLIKISRIDT